MGAKNQARTRRPLKSPWSDLNWRRYNSSKQNLKRAPAPV
nr:MAG TPA: hypothetical protein [Caudoviricetes sp.]